MKLRNTTGNTYSVRHLHRQLFERTLIESDTSSKLHLRRNDVHGPLVRIEYVCGDPNTFVLQPHKKSSLNTTFALVRPRSLPNQPYA